MTCLRRTTARLLALLAVVVLASVASWARAAEGEDKPKFLRVTRDDGDNALSMDTAIVRYKLVDEAKGDVTVDLIGAVHIGERSYYQALNKEFEQYDALLYELVAPEGTRVPRGGGGGSGHPVGMLQNGMKDMLELEHQLECVDYEKENFIHADMSPDDFAKSMSDRGESIWSMMFRMMGQQIAQQNKRPNRTSDFDLMMALFDRNRALSLKRIMADQFEDLEGAMSALDGPNGSTIITERNKVALEVLVKQLEAGKKRIGIFYGAGHMPDMEERLLKDHGLKRDGERWIMAWDLRSKAQRDAAARKAAEAKESKPDGEKPQGEKADEAESNQ